MENIAAFLISLISGLIIGKILIPKLRDLKASQTERKVLESHQKKSGTPTMGGAIFLIALLIGSIWNIPAIEALGLQAHPLIAPVLILTIGFGLIGFADDYLKVVKRRTDGLYPWQKMLLQIVVTTVFAVYLIEYSPVDLLMRVPFGNGAYIDLGWLSIPLLYFAVIGTVNGTNFTDGLDGLATGVTVIVTIFFTIASRMTDGGVEPLGMAMLGGLVAFFVYNRYPAKVFMGDTGSLALGGFVAGMAYVMRLPLFIPIVGIIYLVEVVSVILQVGSFKLRHGKRIFRMAPIHHHFELGGWSETKVVSVFTFVTLIAMIVGMIALM
ncbi:MAG: phospho-N-acetylmuramoyl-pentapeptide-transferase [Lachnospiraceae bacterium]|nr:phospho-N-acetylmuramoyl-pentapeptide-transferase [Lachnospiraceae bacterium]